MHSLLAFILTIPSAWSTSFYIRPFSEFTKTTPNIIRGKTTNIRVENGVAPDGVKTIYTFANLDIKDVIKGSISGSQIQIRKLGGSKDGVTLEIPSSVEFTDKEEGVFFLSEELEDHSYEVSSMELGKFLITEKNGEEILHGGLFDYSKPESGHEHENNVVAGNISENLKPWSIAQLRELVKSQQSSAPTTTPETQKTAVVSNSPEEPKTSAPAINNQSNQTTTISREKEQSTLYFGPSFWYSLATIFLTLGVIFYIRRK